MADVGKIFALFLLLGASLLTGCRHASYSPELEEIDRVIAESPDSALSRLSRISPDSLSEADKNLYRLLTVKAADKNYIRHTSDSLILKVINFYGNHKDDPRYPEALYYGGRVYSDLGDYPTALRHFQSALNLLPEGTGNLRLRSSALSQMGRLLNSLYLNEDAESYLLQAVKTDSLISNESNLAYDHQLLGSIRLRLKNYRSALSSFEKAVEWASRISVEDEAVMELYKAATLYRMNRLDSALKLIRRLPEAVHPDFRNVAYATAAEIFLDAGICDTAAYYARKLINSNIEDNKKTGYKILLSDRLRHLIPSDSVSYYYSSYKRILDEVNADRGSQESIVQHSMYNYSKHERSLQEEKSRNRMLVTVICLAALAVLSSCAALFYRSRNKRDRENKYPAIEYTGGQDSKTENVTEPIEAAGTDIHEDSILEDSEIHETRTEKSLDDSRTDDNVADKSTGTLIEPINIDKEELLKKANDPEFRHELPQELILSEPYQILMKKIQAKKTIPSEGSFWKSLERVIEGLYPAFIPSLTLLVGGNLNANELHTSLLIKCNVTPTQMTEIFGKSAGAISSRREKLSIKIFGKNVGNSTIDNIIKSL